jgi:hypothetical protein
MGVELGIIGSNSTPIPTLYSTLAPILFSTLLPYLELALHKSLHTFHLWSKSAGVELIGSGPSSGHWDLGHQIPIPKIPGFWTFRIPSDFSIHSEFRNLKSIPAHP